MVLPRLLEIRLPDHPETGEVRWRTGGLTPTGSLLICFTSDDLDIEHPLEKDIVYGEDVWCWKFSGDDLTLEPIDPPDGVA